MNKNKVISVIIPVYNSELYLKRCLDSIIGQSYNLLEIILVDDGSTDNSLSICKEYQKKDKRVKVFHKNNGGVSSARNLGLEKCTGNYISFVDSDDFIEKETYKSVVKLINENNCDIAIFNVFFENNNSEKLYSFTHKNFSFDKNNYPKISYNNKCISGYVCNKLYSRNIVFYSTGDYIHFNTEISIGEDDLFNYQIIEKNSNILYYYIDEKLYHYILNNGSATQIKYNNSKLSYFKGKELEIDILNKLSIPCDFLKADYVINYIKTNIVIEKLKLNKSSIFKQIEKQSIKYNKEIKFLELTNKLKIKLILATKFSIAYKIKLYIKKEYI